jgi:hypothetical protein
MARLARTSELVVIITAAKERGYNRQVDVATLGLDPFGIHILQQIMLHEYINGKLTDDVHVRCYGCLKIVGTMEPVRVIMDVPAAMYNCLDPADTIERRVDAFHSLTKILKDTDDEST